MVHGSLRLGAACCTEARAGGGFGMPAEPGGGGDRVEVGIKDVLSHKKEMKVTSTGTFTSKCSFRVLRRG